MSDILNHENWSEWKTFPDPRKQEYIFVPFGLGIYQLINKFTDEYVLFGKGQNVAHTFTTLLSPPLGTGSLINKEKQDYVLSHLVNIQYRSITFETELEMRDFEYKLMSLNIHIFNEDR